MRYSSRKSGIDIVGDVSWGTHVCQFFQTKEDLTDILVPYFKAGLENNEFCLWVTAQPLEVEDAKEALRRTIPDLNIFLEKGQLEIVSYNDWFLTGGAFDPKKVSSACAGKLNYASQKGYEGVRLSGNNSWLDKENWESFIKFKEQMDIVIGNCQMIALCTYSLDNHEVDEIVYLSVNHRFALVKSKGKWKQIDSYKRKMDEEAAVKAAKNWEHTFDAVPDLIAILDTNYRVVRANRAMAAKLRMKPEECIGLTCYNVVHGTTKPPSFCPQREMLKDGSEHTAEVCEDCLGGYFIVSVSPIYNSEGKLTGSIHVARDINERRVIEEALRQSEEKYRNIVETANEGIFMLNAELKVIYVNKRTVEMLGYVLEEIIGRPVIDIISEDFVPIARKNFENRLQGISENYELKLKCKDGSPFWVFLSGRTLLDIDGNFSGTLGMLTDINGRKQAEIELLESETHFRTLAVNSPDLITRFDRQYRHTYANPAAQISYGIHLSEIIGRTQSELGRDPKSVKFWEECLEEAFVTGNTKTIEYHISEEEKKYYFNTKIVPEFVGGNVVSVLTISRDITGIKESEAKLKETLHNLDNLINERTEELQKACDLLKESEEKYRNIVETANEGIAIIDNEFKITYTNNRMAEMLGYAPEQGTGRPIWDFLGEGSKAIVKLNTEKNLSGIDDGYELELIHKDGLTVWAYANSKSLYDKEGKFLGSISMLTNITKRKEAEQALAEIELARKKEIHHRIKNNLQVISSLLDLQAYKFSNRKYIKDSEVLEAFRESQDRVVSMALIHEELYRGGGLDKLNFTQYVEELAENLFHTYTIGNNNIILTKNFESDTFFDMDIAVPLGMLINELISNSFKHAFKGRDEGEIQIKLRREENRAYIDNPDENSKKATFTLTISDNGVGITEILDIEELDSLGLQLVTSLVHQLDGELKINRKNGTEFIIRFTVTEKNNQMVPVTHQVPIPIKQF
jgi:PAS domain S-box-containing protein